MPTVAEAACVGPSNTVQANTNDLGIVGQGDVFVFGKETELLASPCLKDNLAQKEIQVLDYRNAHIKAMLNGAIRDLKQEITRKTAQIYGPD